MPEIKDLTINLIFIAIPGIVCYFIFFRLIGRNIKEGLIIFLLVFLFSVLSYLLYATVEGLLNLIKGSGFQTNIVNKIFNNFNSLEYKEILYATISGIILSFLLSYGYHYNLLNRFGQWIKATNKFGDEDVWHFLQNAPNKDKNGGWVVVRDHKFNLQYFGSISAWSDTDKDRELIISEVTVFTNDTSEELYNMDHIYLCRNKYELTIEIPKKNDQKSEDLNE